MNSETGDFLKIYYTIKICLFTYISWLLGKRFIEDHVEMEADHSYTIYIAIAAVLGGIFEGLIILKKHILEKTIPIYSPFYWPRIISVLFFIISIFVFSYSDSKGFWNFEKKLASSISLPYLRNFKTGKEYKETLAEINEQIKLQEIPKRRELVKPNTTHIEYLKGDGLVSLFITQAVLSIFLWVFLTLMYQIQIVSSFIQAVTVFLLWKSLSGWELLSYLGAFFISISEFFNEFISIGILISYIASFIFKILSLRNWSIE